MEAYENDVGEGRVRMFVRRVAPTEDHAHVEAELLRDIAAWAETLGDDAVLLSVQFNNYGAMPFLPGSPTQRLLDAFGQSVDYVATVAYDGEGRAEVEPPDVTELPRASDLYVGPGDLPAPLVIVDRVTAITARAEVEGWRRDGRIGEHRYDTLCDWIARRRRELGLDDD